MKPRSLHMSTPNMFLTKIVIAMGTGPENYYNLKQLLIYPKIQILYTFDFPIQIAL